MYDLNGLPMNPGLLNILLPLMLGLTGVLGLIGMWLGCIATAQILPVLDFLTGTLTILYHGFILSEFTCHGNCEDEQGQRYCHHNAYIFSSWLYPIRTRWGMSR